MTSAEGSFRGPGELFEQPVRGLLGDATYQISRPFGFRQEDFFKFAYLSKKEGKD